ncbi:acetylornithine deacetylase [Rothia sp. P7181]|uniref:acetylornithine deacetylase n=1 Tax=Rothia sp. P7181 TaxID=3402663 RepID=UPI003ADB6993
MMSTLPDSLPWIQKVIAIPTISETSNAILLELIAQEFLKYGYTPWYTYSDDGERANMYVTIPAADGTRQGGVVLSAHTDVVPVQGQRWDTDPFCATVVGDRLYGRGVADMKSFIGVALWLLERIDQQRLVKPLHFAFSYDEEIGCLGAPRMIAELAERGVRPEYAVVGEPSSMQVIVAHKSAHRGRATFHGIAKHASLAPHGVNAVASAAEFIVFIEQLAQQWLEEGPFDEGFVTPTSTAGANFVQGGLQYNIVGENVVVEYDFRTIPATNREEVIASVEDKLFNDILPRMVQKAQRAERLSGVPEGSLSSQVSVNHELIAAVPGLDTPEDYPLVSLGFEWVGQEYSDTTSLVRVTYGTEAGQFQQAGISAVIIGPGDIAQAHTPNEWIELSQIRLCEQFMLRVLEYSSRPTL